ncbi:MAG TPA: type II toxin-antitoxin system VapC family toxin, partial [Candidatus Bathyarchaeia archaeon]
MTIQYLVDTDWAIHYLNDHEGIVQRLRELQRQEGLALSIISLTELYEGVYYSREPEDDERALQDFLC